jgi:hypothetical protein
MDNNMTYIKLNMICDIACALVEKYGLTVTDAIRYIADTSVIESIDNNPNISFGTTPEYWAKLIHNYSKNLESLNSEHKRIKIE